MDKIYIKVSIFKNLGDLLKEGLVLIQKNNYKGSTRELLARYVFNKIFGRKAEKISFVRDKKTGKFSTFITDGSDFTFIFDEFLTSRIYYLTSNLENNNQDDKKELLTDVEKVLRS
jgi:hypothetical protein